MNILQVCAEIFPLLKTGGLADVAGALPAVLRQRGADVRVLLPGFDAILAGLTEAVPVAELPPVFGQAGVRVLYGRLAAADTTAYVIEAPGFYRRAGGPYADAQQRAFGDNHLRFALLGWVAARLAEGLDPHWRPRVVHAHDWHAGLAPAYLRAAGSRAASVYTVHNLAYQGMFPAYHFGELGLPAHFYGVEGVEFHGHVNFMKAGLYYADRLTTVSPTYAREIQTPEQGMGLDGLLRTRAEALSGVLNGVDEAVWNPATDARISHHFDAKRLKGKAECKAALQAQLGLAVKADAPLLVIVSRLTEQKGLHLMLQALPHWIERGGQFALLGSGDAWMENAFRTAAEARPESVAVRIGYDEDFAHALVAGGDLIGVPSHFEPCGLTQLYGLTYGTLPLVRRVGGLADTVTDCSLENLVDGTATGVVFDEFSVDGLHRAMRRALALYSRPSDWRAVQRTAMAQHCGWGDAADAYIALYRNLGA